MASSPLSPSFSKVSWSNNHGFGHYHGKALFQQATTQVDDQANSSSIFGAPNKEHAAPCNPFQSSRYHDANGSLPSMSTCGATDGALTTSFSFGMPSSFGHELKCPPLHSAQISGSKLRHETGSIFSTVGASPFTSKACQTTQGCSSGSSFSCGITPSNPFKKAPSLANSKEPEARISFQGSPKPFSSSFVNPFSTAKPERTTLFQKSIVQAGDKTSFPSMIQKESDSSKGSMPIVTTPQSPFGPGPPKESFVWRPSTSEENTMFRLEGNTLESQGFFRTPLIQVIPASRGQNVGGPVSTSSFPMFNPMKSASGVSIPGTTSPSPTLGILKPSFDKTCTVQGPVLETFRPFLPFDFGASQLNIVDGMEEDNIMALSATPSNENISPEELRWQDYQAKKKDFTFVCKVCNHAGSLTPMPSSSEPPTSYDSPSSSSPTLPLSGNQNAVQFAPFMLGLSSAPAIVSSSRGSSNDGIATLSSPLRPYPLTEAQETNSDSKAIQPSSQTASMMCPEQVIAENPVVAPSLGTALTSYSSIPSHPSLQFGISSLPVTDKSFQTQSISLLASSKHVFQKTVIRMQARRHGSAKRDGPRVSFVNDYIN